MGKPATFLRKGSTLYGVGHFYQGSMTLSIENTLAGSDLMVGAVGIIEHSWSSESVNHILDTEQDYDDVLKPAGIVGHGEPKENKNKRHKAN